MRAIHTSGGTIDRMEQSESESSSSCSEWSSDSFRLSWPQESPASRSNDKHLLLGNSNSVGYDPSSKEADSTGMAMTVANASSERGHSRPASVGLALGKHEAMVDVPVTEADKASSSGRASIRRSHVSPRVANGKADSVKRSGFAESDSLDGLHELSSAANCTTLIGLNDCNVTTKQDVVARITRRSEMSNAPWTRQQAPASANAAGQESSERPKSVDDQSTPSSSKETCEVKGRARPGLTRSKDDDLGGRSARGLQFVPNEFRTSLAVLEGTTTSLQPLHLAVGRIRAGNQMNSVSDASSTVPAPQIVSSTPTRLEVGIFNGTHGWLRIRAELGAVGTVNASVTTVDAAHDALRSAVPEIASYLGGEAVKVGSIEIHRFSDGSDRLPVMGSEGAPNHQQQREDQGKNMFLPPADSRPRLVEAEGTDPQQRSNRSGVGWLGDSIRYVRGLQWRGEYTGSGTWLNVCA
jgi:hypothetical protein